MKTRIPIKRIEELEPLVVLVNYLLGRAKDATGVDEK